jgi:hypothetical protein
MRTMLEVGHLLISVDSFVAQTRQQAPESGGQPGHHGILGGPSFEPLEDRVEDHPGTRTLESARYFHNAFGARLLKLVDE